VRHISGKPINVNERVIYGQTGSKSVKIAMREYTAIKNYRCGHSERVKAYGYKIQQDVIDDAKKNDCPKCTLKKLREVD